VCEYLPFSAIYRYRTQSEDCSDSRFGNNPNDQYSWAPPHSCTRKGGAHPAAQRLVLADRAHQSGTRRVQAGDSLLVVLLFRVAGGAKAKASYVGTIAPIPAVTAIHGILPQVDLAFRSVERSEIILHLTQFICQASSLEEKNAPRGIARGSHARRRSHEAWAPAQ
jgi:hypothetical protein